MAKEPERQYRKSNNNNGGDARKPLNEGYERKSPDRPAERPVSPEKKK